MKVYVKPDDGTLDMAVYENIVDATHYPTGVVFLLDTDGQKHERRGLILRVQEDE